MPTFNDPTKDAEEARQALRGLAHATRNLEDPSVVYDLLGALSQAITSMGQTLNQIGGFHDTLKRHDIRPVVADSSRTGYSASYQVSWELHRAAEMTRQIAKVVDHAREIEARIAYSRPVEQTARTTSIPGNGITL
ncbi:hypothetical protein [Nocardioides panzhihuensis]|uniref:Uncharacterized protein n=1 Tax=Nocardioides panzhihuensis TaxID=860243 RepID=A0A7Z0DK35_9ACTN|nr:hypothetical protein [Nocardioides panzhihuensis]NYI77081.1 hypothetical protein [Nocardioides panzhihuensis]